jgi:hypothetical protein
LANYYWNCSSGSYWIIKHFYKTTCSAAAAQGSASAATGNN